VLFQSRQRYSQTCSGLTVGLARLAIVALVAIATPAAVSADDNKSDPETTADGRRIVRLLEVCTSPDTNYCDSYINGFLDGYWLSNTHSFDMFPSNKAASNKRPKKGLSANRMADKVFTSGICLPDGVLLEELRTVLVTYLVANKDAWKNTMHQEQLWRAFKTEYPCVIDTEQNTDTR